VRGGTSGLGVGRALGCHACVGAVANVADDELADTPIGSFSDYGAALGYAVSNIAHIANHKI